MAFVNIDYLDNNQLVYDDSTRLFSIIIDNKLVVEFTEFGIKANGLIALYNSVTTSFYYFDYINGVCYPVGQFVHWISGFHFQGSRLNYIGYNYSFDPSAKAFYDISKSVKLTAQDIEFINKDIVQLEQVDESKNLWKMNMKASTIENELEKIKFYRIFGVGKTMKTINPAFNRYKTESGEQIKNLKIMLGSQIDCFGVFDVRTSEIIVPAEYSEIHVLPGLIYACKETGEFKNIRI
jgi:hypothetical protein